MANARIVEPSLAVQIAVTLAVAVWLLGSVSPLAAETGEASDGPPAQTLVCFVSILPQAYFVERIGGKHVDVTAMVGPGQSPATYEPTAKQLAGLAAAQVYFSIGVPFEDALLSRIERSFGNVTIIDTRAGIERVGSPGALEAEKSAVTGNHNHHHGSLDPHVWLSPRLAKTIAVNIREALLSADPAHQNEYGLNCDALIDDLDKLDREITAMMAPLKGGRFYVFHPAYGHFAREYGLVQVAVEIEGATPGPKHLADIIEQAEADNVRVLFVQPQFSKNTAEMIANAIDARIVPLDPLAQDYPANLLEIAHSISEALANNDGAPPRLDKTGRQDE